MDRNALGPECLTVPCYLEQIRQIAAPAISEQGNFVDVYTQSRHKP
jgi:hypothetical protein